MIKIGLDISQVAHRGGVGRYTENLAKSLLSQKQLELIFFYSSLRKKYQGDLPNVKSFLIPPTIFEALFNQARLIPIEKLIGEIDIFHSSDWTQPKTKAKKVTTYHDVIPLKYPEWSDPKIVKVHRRRLELVEKEIDMVIAVSESTKTDLLAISSIPETKIKVVYEGVDDNFKVLLRSEVEEFKKKYDLPDKFFLAIGGVGKRRNLERIKQATAGFNLVISGQSLPWLPDSEMPLLYNSAEVLIYASFYEGFGLPILESMKCGTPVITSNVSSMPEIAGGAALLVNPQDLGDISKKLKQLIGDKSLQSDLRAKGLKRSASFTWEKCASETSKYYQDLVLS